MALAPQSKHVFLMENDAAMRERVGSILRRAGYRVSAEAHGEAATRKLTARNLDALIVAPDWPERETTKRVAALKRKSEGIPLLLVCPPGGAENAVRAMRHGVDDYVLRPPDAFELRARLERILDRQELDSRIAFFQDELSKRSGFKSLEARSPSMRAVVTRMMRVAPMRATVLIFGESGVGKELVARSIHFHSPRRERPFIALNCAAMPPSLIESELFGHEKGAFTGAHTRTRGKFEIAHRGTLFLDEIGEMDLNTQAKLLRVLDEREFMRIGGDQSIRVDVRVIAATNADLESMVATSRFRRDLYYRLKVVTITVPPLRERRQDIPELTQTFLDALSKANAVSPRRLEPDALAALVEYAWPGNVRELKNFLESALVSATGDSIGLEALPRAIRQSRSRPSSMELVAGNTLAEMERELIVKTLEHTGGNRTHGAAMLGIGVRTLQRKIQAYGISIPSKRRRRRGETE